MPSAEQNRVKENAVRNAGSFIIESANTVFGSALLADIPPRVFSRPSTHGSYHNIDPTIRLRFGEAMIHFMKLTGWGKDNPALQYIAASLYLSFVDSALANTNLFAPLTGRDELQETRRLMQEPFDRWRARLTDDDRKGIDDWYVFFVGKNKMRTTCMKLFTEEGRDAAFAYLRQCRDAQEEEQQIVTDTGAGLQAAPSREALLRRLGIRSKPQG